MCFFVSLICFNEFGGYVGGVGFGLCVIIWEHLQVVFNIVKSYIGSRHMQESVSEKTVVSTEALIIQPEITVDHRYIYQIHKQ